MKIHHKTITAAEKRGYRLQLSQHKPDGLEGAWSLQCFALPESGKEDKDFSLYRFRHENITAIKIIVSEL